MARKNPLGKIKDTAIGTAKLPFTTAEKAVSTVVGGAKSGVDLGMAAAAQVAAKAGEAVSGILPGKKAKAAAPSSPTTTSVAPTKAAPVAAPTASAAPTSRSAKPTPVAGSAKTGGDPLKASGKKPDAVVTPVPAAKKTPVATKASSATKAAAAKKASPATKAPVATKATTPTKATKPVSSGAGAPKAVNPVEELGLDPSPVAEVKPAVKEAPVTNIDAAADAGSVEVTPADIASSVAKAPAATTSGAKKPATKKAPAAKKAAASSAGDKLPPRAKRDSSPGSDQA